MATLDAFTHAYLVCALWSSTDETTPAGGEPLDSNYSIDDIAPESVAQAVNECREFQAANARDLAVQDPGQNGHDFWLTRNRHGAGYWDRGLGAVGDRLTEAAQACGERNAILSEGLIYIE